MAAVMVTMTMPINTGCNANAIGLYKSLSFEIEGLHRKAVCIEGQYENLHSMALLRV